MKQAISINSIDRNYDGKTIELSGWVDTVRDHGGLLFADLRNRSGKIQLVFDVSAKSSDFRESAEKIRPEFVIQIKGAVRMRPEESVNKKIPTGEIELAVDELIVLNSSKPPPFYPGDDVGEETKLKYRYIDLRGHKMLANLSAVDRIMKVTREYFSSMDFIEVITPMLTKSTPEGARDYLVPARTQPGAFFALPQSPQLFKQVLMASGVERYFQIVKCFRDEDLRADRQPEFTQIDMEMSFASEQDIMETVWELVKKMFDAFGIEISDPVSMQYKDAVEKYGSDKPDLRITSPELVELTDVFRNTEFKVFRSQIEKGRKIVGYFIAKDFSRGELDSLTDRAKELGAGGLVWIKKNGTDLKSPVVKLFGESEISALLEAFTGDGVIFISTSDSPFELMGRLRSETAVRTGLTRKGFFPVWVVNAPLFEKGKDGNIQSPHHPFTAPLGNIFEEDPFKIGSLSYDIVINGEELGGGSVRIHDVNVQKKVFEVLGIPEREYNGKFGFLMNALEYGCPPHGGFAFGMERVAAMLLGLESIRDVIAFPKTQNASCPMTGAPDKVSGKQLSELGIKIVAE